MSAQPAPALKAAVQRVVVDENHSGQRLDNFLLGRLKGAPKTLIYRIIRKGEVRVNKGRSSPDYRVLEGDEIRIPPVRLGEEAAQVPVRDGLRDVLEESIIHETESLLIINKPSGIAVHGGSGISLGVIEAMRQLRPDCKALELVHRLDRDTSGCLMLAKKRSALRQLQDDLRGDGVKKQYLALVEGRWSKRHLSIDMPLRKYTLASGERMVKVDIKEGKPSSTKFEVMQYFDNATLVRVSPLTGRTHQIRVHTQYGGHSIAGDDKYGNPEFNQRMQAYGLRRLFLHAESLHITDPATGRKLHVSAPLPDDLQKVLAALPAGA